MYGLDYPYYGAVPQMQARLNQLEGYQAQQQQLQAQQMQQQVSPLRGRTVTCMEEVKAAQVMLDGTSAYFPSPSESRIYEKSIDLNGNPVYKIYELSKKPIKNPVESLEEKVNELELMVRELQGRRVENESNATDRDAKAGTKPHGDVKQHG
nr:MAG TPA: hypothetical protein [Caudoviricetes sp.]